MNLNNFEDYVPDVILERGMDYYHDLAVEDLQETQNGQWFAIVEGTKNYEVDIRLDKNYEILKYQCNCPYEGEICKHVVAVLYEIQEEVDQDGDERAFQQG